MYVKYVCDFIRRKLYYIYNLNNLKMFVRKTGIRQKNRHFVGVKRIPHISYQTRPRIDNY